MSLYPSFSFEDIVPPRKRGLEDHEKTGNLHTDLYVLLNKYYAGQLMTNAIKEEMKDCIYQYLMNLIYYGRKAGCACDHISGQGRFIYGELIKMPNYDIIFDKYNGSYIINTV